MDQNPQPITPTPEPTPTPVSPMPTADPVAPAPAAAPVTAAPVAVAENPGKTLGIVSLVLSILGFGLIGLIVGIIGKKKSSAVGQKNVLALVGIILGILNVVATTLFIIVVAYNGVTLAAKCNDYGPGTHNVDGVVLTCS